MKSKIIYLTLLAGIFISCTSKNEKLQTKKEKTFHNQTSYFCNTYVNPIKEAKNKALEDFLSSLSLEEKISQLFIENLEGNIKFRTYENYGAINKTENSKGLVAGSYLFFSYNLQENPKAIMEFCDSIKDFCIENNLIPPFLAIDQEGGLVNRLRNITGPLPSQQRVRENLTLEESYNLYSLQAKQMKLLGFHMNLAPVIEVETPENKEFLSGRSFGDYDFVKEYGKLSVKAYEENGISTVIKHFPGNTNTDPHIGLPVIDLPQEDLQKLLEPFIYVMKQNPKGILMSHAITSQIQDLIPSCLSYYWVTEILRNKYNYRGIIFSDDIFMGALADNGYAPEDACIKAIEAGIDCIMISEKRFAKPASYLYKKAIQDKDFSNKINLACKRIIEYKIDCGILEYSPKENGEYEIKICNKQAEYDEKLNEFLKLKQENIKFYREYF